MKKSIQQPNEHRQKKKNRFLVVLLMYALLAAIVTTVIFFMFAGRNKANRSDSRYLPDPPIVTNRVTFTYGKTQYPSFGTYTGGKVHPHGNLAASPTGGAHE